MFKNLLFIFVLLQIGSFVKNETTASSVLSILSNNNLTSNSTQTPPSTIPAQPTLKPEYVSECVLSKSSSYEKSLLEKVNTLKGEKYTWEDDDHQYFFSICSTAENAEEKDQGFIQMNKKQKKKFVLGRLNDVDLEGATNLIRMVYKNGDNYASACNKDSRTAVIYLICNPNDANSTFKMIEENNDRGDDCAYVFELKTPKVCNIDSYTTHAPSVSTTSTSATSAAPTSESQKDNNNIPSQKKLGFFSISLIVLISLLSVYLMVGTLYMRYVKRSRGWEQIPNFWLWSAIGNGSADCCNYICRCGQRTTEVHTYEHINDRLSDDENLLNM